MLGPDDWQLESLGACAEYIEGLKDAGHDGSGLFVTYVTEQESTEGGFYPAKIALWDGRADVGLHFDGKDTPKPDSGLGGFLAEVLMAVPLSHRIQFPLN